MRGRREKRGRDKLKGRVKEENREKSGVGEKREQGLGLLTFEVIDCAFELF